MTGFSKNFDDWFEFFKNVSFLTEFLTSSSSQKSEKTSATVAHIEIFPPFTHFLFALAEILGVCRRFVMIFKLSARNILDFLSKCAHG